MYYYGPMGDGNDWGWGALMIVLWFLFFILVAVIVARLVRGREAGPAGKSDPLDIAKERYAKGEITKEQFEQLKKDLK